MEKEPHLKQNVLFVNPFTAYFKKKPAFFTIKAVFGVLGCQMPLTFATKTSLCY